MDDHLVKYAKFAGFSRGFLYQGCTTVGAAAQLTTVTLLTSRNAGFAGAYQPAATTPGFPA